MLTMIMVTMFMLTMILANKKIVNNLFAKNNQFAFFRLDFKQPGEKILANVRQIVKNSEVSLVILLMIMMIIMMILMMITTIMMMITIIMMMIMSFSPGRDVPCNDDVRRRLLGIYRGDHHLHSNVKIFITISNVTD